MHREPPISETHQMYLKALHKVCETSPVGRVRDLAEELGVTPSTVSTVLNRLHEMGLIERERYGGALLTAAGSVVAECVINRFEILRELLIDVLGVNPEQAEIDACTMEHAVSPVTVHRMAAFLERLRSGETIDLQGLSYRNGDAGFLCADCEAAGFCMVTESRAQQHTSSR